MTIDKFTCSCNMEHKLDENQKKLADTVGLHLRCINCDWEIIIEKDVYFNVEDEKDTIGKITSVSEGCLISSVKCIKDVVMNISEEIAYIKDKNYRVTINKNSYIYATDEQGEEGHCIGNLNDNDDFFKSHFIWSDGL